MCERVPAFLITICFQALQRCPPSRQKTTTNQFAFPGWVQGVKESEYTTTHAFHMFVINAMFYFHIIKYGLQIIFTFLCKKGKQVTNSEEQSLHCSLLTFFLKKIKHQLILVTIMMTGITQNDYQVP